VASVSRQPDPSGLERLPTAWGDSHAPRVAGRMARGPSRDPLGPSSMHRNGNEQTCEASRLIKHVAITRSTFTRRCGG